jgi:glutamyl-tRNA(Gln) amidotransferase subunit E
LKHLKRKGLPVEKLEDLSILAIFQAYKNKNIVKEAIPIIVEQWLTFNSRSIEDVMAQNPIMNKKEVIASIKIIIQQNEQETIHDAAKKLSFFIGQVMKKIKGRFDGKMIVELTAKHLNDSSIVD